MIEKLQSFMALSTSSNDDPYISLFIYNIVWPIMLLYSFLSLLLLHTSFALVIPPKSTSNAQENALLILPASGVNH